MLYFKDKVGQLPQNFHSTFFKIGPLKTKTHKSKIVVITC